MLAHQKGDTLNAIGLRYGVSREAVRQFVARRLAPGAPSRTNARPFSLSAADRDGILRYFGSHRSEKLAIEYFFAKVPVSEQIVAFTVYDKGRVDVKRLWHGVLRQGEEFVRRGAPSYNRERALAYREAAVTVELSPEADELANLLGPTEVLRNHIKDNFIVKKTEEGFTLEIVEMDELSKLLG